MPDLATIVPGLQGGYTVALKNVQGAGLLTFGNIWYVSSVNGSDSNVGNSPATAFATLNQARSQATANNGDVIFLLPGHTETIVGAAGVLISKAGLTIIGIGNGTLRPTFSFTTAAAASFDITAANTTIQNCIFSCAINAQTAMSNVSASDVSFFDCDFVLATATGVSTILGILTAATANRLKVIRCRFTGTAAQTTATTAAIQHEAGVDYVVQDCMFVGKQTQSILNVATVLRGLIHNNIFTVGTGTLGITMAAASTPMITNNRFNVASGTTPITAAAGFVAGNIYSAAAGVTSTGGTSAAAAVSTL